jgi:4-hydroxythreonine-4-phosphate dehydrogenase
MTHSVVLTIGNGIGPEIVARWLAHCRLDVPVTLIGDTAVLMAYQPVLPEGVSLLSVEGEAGYIAYQSLAIAVDIMAKRHQHGERCGLVTGPISKAALWQAGFTQYTGHTEILADLAKQHWPVHPCQSDMLFVYNEFRLLLLTRHVPLSAVSHTLTLTEVTQSLTTLVGFLQTQCHIPKPRLALLGVNPHAGEIGGLEEANVLIPASHAVMNQLNCWISPPMAADGFFRGFSSAQSGYDAIVSPYHDQGLIPFKLLAGWRAVNVTIGLPFMRTSVSHGTAPDIVGQGVAKPDSLIAAFDCLCQWLKG